jgi:hypothetical protein
MTEADLDFYIFQTHRASIKAFGMRDIIDLLIKNADNAELAAYLSNLAFVEWTMTFKTIKEEEVYGKQGERRDVDGQEGEGYREGDGQKGALNRVFELPKQRSPGLDDAGKPLGD